MAKKSADILKTYFESGDRPTQSNFSDLIDSTHNDNLGGVGDYGTTSGDNEISLGEYTTNTYNISGDTNFTLNKADMINGNTYTILLIFEGDHTVTFSSDFYDLEDIVAVSGNHILISGQYINTKFYTVKSKTFDAIDIATPNLTITSLTNVGSAFGVNVSLTDSEGTAQNMRIIDVDAGSSEPSIGDWASASVLTFDTNFIHTAGGTGSKNVYVRAYNSEGDYDTTFGTVSVFNDTSEAVPNLTLNSITDLQDGDNVSISLSDSEGTANTMKIISQTLNSGTPSSGDWISASATTFSTSFQYSLGSTGSYDIYIRGYNTENEYDTVYGTVSVTLAPVVSTIYKITFGENNSTFESVASGWNSNGVDVEGSSPLTLYTTSGNTGSATIQLASASMNVIKRSNLNIATVSSSNVNFPDAVLIKGSDAYGRFITDGTTGLYYFDGFDTSATYSFEIFSSVNLSSTGWATSDADSVTFRLIGAATVSSTINPVNNLSNTVDLSVKPDVSGRIELQMYGDEDWDHAFVNAMIITKN